ncbi:MAG: VOC family protein [bacterium]|nr:hypothetical protein [Gammaproteobacteria bacterium]HIL96134.1 hypothetical protein [Pseudomonadales bacterium]
MITGMPRIAIAVHDFGATVELFRDKLGMPVIDMSDSSVQNLGAKLAMCTPAGGSNIELMSPGDPATPLSQSLERFLDRRGEGLFALMLEAPDPNAEATDLIERGLNVLPLMAGAGGRDVHPKSTHGVLIRVYPENSFGGSQADDADLSAGLSGIARVIIAVKNLDDAMDVYGRQFNMVIEEPFLDSERGVCSSLCRPPAGGTIELVSVENGTRPFANSIQNFLDSNSEGMYALVLQTDGSSTINETLAARGMSTSASNSSPNNLELDSASTLGVRFILEPARV